MSHCHVLPHLCPLQAEPVVVGSQQGLPCGSIGTVTMGQESVADEFPAIPYSIQIPHLHRQGRSTYEVILLEHPQQSMVLMRYGLLRSPHGLGTRVFSGSRPPLDVVDGSVSQTQATSNSTLPHALMGKCKHFLPNTYRGWMGYY